jgi:uncharacterized protein (TIGR04255 family)
MSNAPVYYALAQARFNPVPAMANKYIAQIQDRLRREGYPLFEQHQVTHLVVLGQGQAQQGVPQFQQHNVWHITRSDRTAGFVLAPSMITFHTTHYQTSDEFIPELLRGLSAVHEAVKLDHVGRLGLRYLDAVLPRTSETAEQYLVEGLHGIKFSAPQQQNMTETVFSTENHPLLPAVKGMLVVRVYRMTTLLGLPPDIHPGSLVFNPKFDMKAPQEHAVIDTDHFIEGHMLVDMDKLSEQIRTLHTGIKAVFEATTTAHARNTWA